MGLRGSARFESVCWTAHHSVPVGAAASSGEAQVNSEMLLEPNQWEKLLEVEIARGETARVEVPSR